MLDSQCRRRAALLWQVAGPVANGVAQSEDGRPQEARSCSLGSKLAKQSLSKIRGLRTHRPDASKFSDSTASNHARPTRGHVLEGGQGCGERSHDLSGSMKQITNRNKTPQRNRLQAAKALDTEEPNPCPGVGCGRNVFPRS